jgi:NAD(P)-dependent dehydrogenase (short-subunit alcohol dehydrogenase family)
VLADLGEAGAHDAVVDLHGSRVAGHVAEVSEPESVRERSPSSPGTARPAGHLGGQRRHLSWADVLSMRPDQWRRALDTNLSGASAAARPLRAITREGTGSEAAVTDTAARIPLRRVPQPDDIARVILFAASGLASMMSGNTLAVDGGRLAC